MQLLAFSFPVRYLISSITLDLSVEPASSKFKMMDIRVKVRPISQSSSLWLLLLLMISNMIHVLQSVSVSSSRTDLDKECLKIGINYVFDEAVQTCVSCSTCECLYIEGNPHCGKCVTFGILNCQTTTAPLNSPQETTRPPLTTMLTTLTTAKGLLTTLMTLTTMPQSTASPNGDSGDNSTWKIVLVVSLGILAVILVMAVFFFKWRKKHCPQKKDGELGNNLEEMERLSVQQPPVQESQPPLPSHPMTQEADGNMCINESEV